MQTLILWPGEDEEYVLISKENLIEAVKSIKGEALSTTNPNIRVLRVDNTLPPELLAYLQTTTHHQENTTHVYQESGEDCLLYTQNLFVSTNFHHFS